MKLELCTPLRTQTYTIAWLELNSTNGNYTIQQGHTPTMIVLTPHSELSFRLESGKQESIIVLRGIVRITRDGAIALVEESNQQP